MRLDSLDDYSRSCQPVKPALGVTPGLADAPALAHGIHPHPAEQVIGVDVWHIPIQQAVADPARAQSSRWRTALTK